MEEDTKKFLKDGLGWGAGLWLVGYVLGIVLFMMVPANLIGWVISPIGILITLWVLFYKIYPAGHKQGGDLAYYFKIAIVWTVIAVMMDYFFLAQLFKPADGYYKADVYFYYFITFALLLIAGFIKNSGKKAKGFENLEEFNEARDKKVNEAKQKIFEEIKKSGSTDAGKVKKLLSVSRTTAFRYLDELEKEGKIEQMGEMGRGVEYKAK